MRRGARERRNLRWPVFGVFVGFAMLLSMSCGQKEGSLSAQNENAGTVPAHEPGIVVPPQEESPRHVPAGEEEKAMAFRITSTAFSEGAVIPEKYTGEGADVSPPLAWMEPPEETKAFVLINDDPDAPTGAWVHWVVYNIGADVRELPEGQAKTENLPNGIKQGMTDFKRVGYGGPMPPPGKPHRYFFKLYALDAPLNLPARATKAQVEKAMEGHILGKAQLMGTYQR